MILIFGGEGVLKFRSTSAECSAPSPHAAETDKRNSQVKGGRR